LPVHVGGLTVNHGDLLHGDANGVIRIPHEIASEIPAVAAEFAAAERIILDYVQPTGSKSVTELAHRRQEFAAIVAKLSERVRKRR
jgi:regulator of RNase E activity RraA